MEDEVCKFHKFGFCKFREACKRKHLTPICESQSECKDKKQCHKRHPKSCKRFNSENGCKHGEECAYNHQVDEKFKEVNELKEKVDILEKIVAKKVSKERERLEQLEIVVKAMSRKVLSLESELKDLKRKRKPSEEESIFKIKEIKRKEGDELQLIKSNTKLSDHKKVNPKEKNQPKSKKKIGNMMI